MDKKNILLVEGPDDKGAVGGLMKKYEVNPNFDFEIGAGIDQLIAKFDLYLKNAAAYGVIGLVVDADDDANARWQQIRDRLTKSGKYKCNKMSLAEGGVILEAEEQELDATVGVWIMPDNKYKGTLENFLLEMVDDGDKLMEEVERELVHLEETGIKRYRDIDRNKAKIHTFLAWGKIPGASLHTAIMSRIFDSNVDLAGQFMDWIRRLYKI